ncbi:trypsin-like peptidase domain-containing protein [Prochlorococcus marinus]|uniref:Putative serine protease n=1 Tax=Prochlorococcus marinus str. MIT 9401 TaxID=167551 RepID=A0A0A2AYR6_PROMR|nr:trypsin-like peptidase domain-containing protein [Prochlorococcus marinus]KGG06173.1 putative serine protease [Prochlorococcus marinus str. MIT 9322]KGG06746.1 putative serine protease [Prochlorococcus marinus str. MIT 9401]
MKLGKHKQILSSVITLGFLFPANVISQPLIKPKINEVNINSNKSFITKAVEKTGSSVVTIDSQRYVRKKNLSRNSQIFLDPYFERFFGLDLPGDNQPRIEQSQGSGFIFADGLVMTNSHVVNGSDKLIVGLTNGQKLNAKLIGQDFFTDLAVLKIEGKGPWPIAELGDSTKIKVGDWAIAVGNPFGLENTVTLGIISNLNRNVTQLGIYDKKLELIQTDAAINPGNSGGPLLNSYGQVIGINTLIRSGPGAGLSFAIPINKAKEIAYQLINNGKVIHPMIGISLIDEINAKTNNNAVKVGYVVPNSPAAKSGIIVNDRIIKVGGKEIKTASDVISQISKNGINKEINIILKRRNKIIRLKVKPTDITNLQN